MTRSAAETSQQLRQQVKEDIFVPEGNSIGEQFKEIGTYYGENIRKSAEDKLQDFEAADLIKERATAQRILTHLKTLATNSQEFGTNAQEFLEAANGWISGAHIEGVAERHGFSPIETVIEILNDDVGCQSVLARTADGVALIHTEEEEDVVDRVNKSYLTKIGNLTNFSYSDLMPLGAAFSVDEKQGFAFSAVTIRTKDFIEGQCLAKIAGWMICRLGNKATPEVVTRLFKELGPFVDGYAMNVAYYDESVKKSIAYRATICGDVTQIDILPEEPGSYLKQISIADQDIIERVPRLAELVLSKEEIDEDDSGSSYTDREGKVHERSYSEAYAMRLRRIEQIMALMKNNLQMKWEEIDKTKLHKTILRVLGLGENIQGGWGTSNYSVGATFSTFIGKETSVGIALGPSLARKGDINEEDLLILNTPTHA